MHILDQFHQPKADLSLLRTSCHELVGKSSSNCCTHPLNLLGEPEKSAAQSSNEVAETDATAFTKRSLVVRSVWFTAAGCLIRTL